MPDYKGIAREHLNKADIQIGGSRPWDLQVHDESFYRRVIMGGSLALGESYMDGWWDVESLDQFFHRLLRLEISAEARSNWRTRVFGVIRRLLNLQRKARAFKIGEHHYDLDNDLYEAMLDERMVYSCAYWKDATTLNEAQEAKLDLICRKLKLESGMRVLDIGCGWGSFAQYAADKYDVRVVGITVSKQQAELGRERCSGLPIEIRLQDYRELNERFDRITSIGMFEHVGHKNYPTYFDVARRCLVDDGLFLLHTIGAKRAEMVPDLWVQKYIFPGGILPGIQHIGEAIEDRFIMEDWHNFGAYYDPTLMAWHANFEANWHKMKEKYDNRFYRMWRYYLLSFAGAFRARQHQLWQIVLSKQGLDGGYVSLR